MPLFLEASLLGLVGYAVGIGAAWVSYKIVRHQSRGWHE
jgi:hypothetical protein